MRITKIHVTGFGCLRDIGFSFDGGLHTVCRENGFGKSTLIGFIKAMLYGFSDTKRMNLDENDRKKYLPWDGGVCGGSLCIETKDGTFRIERTFGEKASADTLRVLDEKSGLLTDRLGKVPGYTLFGIDADGFLRTLCLSERSFADGVQNESVADLLSRTVTSGGDMTGADEAIALLQKQQKQLQKRGGKGEIAIMGEQIARHRARLLSLEESAHRAKTLAENLQQKKVSLSQKKNALDEICDEDARLEALEQMARERVKKEHSLAVTSGLLEQLCQRLGKEPIDIEQIDRIQQIEIRLDSMKKQGEQDRARLCELFDGKLEREELDMKTIVYNSISKRDVHNKIQEFWQRYPELRGDRIASIDEVQLYQRRRKILSLFPVWICAFIVGLLLLLGASQLSTLLYPIGVALILFPTVFLLLFPVPKQKKDTRTRVSRTLIALKGIPKRQLYALLANREQILLLEKEQAEIERKECDLREFLARFGIHENALSRGMETLYSLYADYEHYKNAMSARELEEQRKLRDEVDQFHLRYRDFGSVPYAALRQALYERDRLMHECDELRSALETPQQSNEQELEMLRSRAVTLRDEIRELELAIAREEAELSHLQVSVDAIDEERSALAEISARRMKLEKRLDVLAKTEQFLRCAKKGMELSYLGAARESLRRVLDTLGEVDAERIHLNQSFEISREEQGLSRPMDAFSRGERDLYRLATRLALIDTLYNAEDRPPLIVDDPFLTFDDARLEGALFYLRALGRDTQILYFTCARARM